MRAVRSDRGIWHPWACAQVVVVMMIFTTHGSSDVIDGIGFWIAAFRILKSGIINETADAPI